MKIWAWGTVAVSTLSLVVVACGSGGGDTGGSGNSSTGGQPSTVSSSGTQSTSSSGSTSSSSGAGGSSPCGSTPWDDMNADCNQCMLDNCCSELAACDVGTACGMLFDCIGQCQPGDKACLDNCNTTQAAGLADAQSLETCYENGCKGTTACATKVCNSGLAVADQGCGDCLTASCCDSWTACGQDSTNACVTCMQDSTTEGCDTNELFQAASDCESTQCQMQCANQICDSGLSSQNPTCDYCLGQNCCAPVKACGADQDCLGCLSTGGTAPGCDTNASYQSVKACWNSNCSTDCGTTGG